MSELAAMRVDFTRQVGRLIEQAEVVGVRMALNECKRSDEQAIVNASGEMGRRHVAKVLKDAGWFALAAAIENNGAANGIRNSLHEEGLAVDVVVWGSDGGYVERGEEYRVLGEWWEASDPRAAWGGRFGDEGHFSFRWRGKK